MKTPLTRRFWAFLIDYNAVGLASWLFVFAIGQPSHEGFLEYQVTGSVGLIVPLIWFGMLVVPEWLSGATLGKNVLGLRVLQKNGARLGLGAATVRRVFDVVDFWASCCLVALLIRNETKLGQRLGDVVSGSVVVLNDKKRATQMPKPTGAGAPEAHR